MSSKTVEIVAESMERDLKWLRTHSITMKDQPERAERLRRDMIDHAQARLDYYREVA